MSDTEQQTATPEAPPAEGFDFGAYAAHLAKPKQYDQGAPDNAPTGEKPPAPDAPPPDPPPTGAPPPPDDKPPGAPQEDHYTRKARVYLKAWNRISGGLLSAATLQREQYPPEVFMLDVDEQEEAAQSLAEGMREGQVPVAPWWAPLAAVVGMQLLTAVPVILEARKARKKAEQAPPPQQERPRRPQPPPEPVEVEHITPGGQAKPGEPAKVVPPVPRVPTPRKERTDLPRCAHPGCTKHVKKRGRIYCSAAHARLHHPGRRGHAKPKQAAITDPEQQQQ